MDHSLYLAMEGAKRTMYSQSISSNNLANVSTTGFKADLYQAHQVALFGDTLPTRVYGVSDAPMPDLTPGAIVQTGNNLDVAVSEGGFLAVKMPDGSEAYTRMGNLQTNATGTLMTASGYPVQGAGGEIVIPPSNVVDIGRDGTISVRPIGQGPESIATIDKLKLVSMPNDQVAKLDNGLFVRKDGLPATTDEQISVVSGALESSNVNAVGEMINIISLARQFEIQMKYMQTTEQNDQAVAQLLQE